MTRPLKILPDIAGAYSLIIFIGFLLFAGKKALGDGDTLWHIKFGDLILQRGALITHDIFSHTASGKPWTSHEWLAEIIMSLVHRVAGLPGVVIFYFLIAALSFWILFKIAQQCGASDWLAIFAVSLALGLSMTHLLARPHIFTWLFGLITLYILLEGGRRLFLLPLLMIPWTNLHGGFALGLALQGIFLLGGGLDSVNSRKSLPFWKELWDKNKIPFLVLLSSLLITGINPFGYRLLLFPFEVSSGSFSILISEWQGPNFQEFWYLRGYLLFLLFILCLSGPKITWTNRLLLLFFMNAALTHVRHVSILGLFLTPLVVQAISPHCKHWSWNSKKSTTEAQLTLSPVTGPVATLFLGICLISFSAFHWRPWEELTNLIIPLPDKFSSGVVEFLNNNQSNGKMFNHDEWGDYLIYSMNPPPELFLDGRLDMYGEKIAQDYAKIVTLDKEAERLLETYGIEQILFPPAPFTRYLAATGRWEEIYRDSQVLLLIRNQQQTK